MKPPNNQDFIPLSAHIKLLQRHLQEWRAMLFTQKQVCRLVQERLNQQDSSNTNLPIDKLCQLTNRANHIHRLRKRHFSERNDLKIRHQQEEATLTQVIKEHWRSEKSAGMIWPPTGKLIQF